MEHNSCRSVDLTRELRCRATCDSSSYWPRAALHWHRRFAMRHTRSHHRRTAKRPRRHDLLTNPDATWPAQPVSIHCMCGHLLPLARQHASHATAGCSQHPLVHPMTSTSRPVARLSASSRSRSPNPFRHRHRLYLSTVQHNRKPLAPGKDHITPSIQAHAC